MKTSPWVPFVISIVLGVGCARGPSGPGELGARSLASLGPCGIEVTKVNYKRVGKNDGTLQAVELRVSSFTPGMTFGDCGLTTVVPWEGAGQSACTEKNPKHAVDLGALPIPEGGIALLGRGGISELSPPPDATTAATSGLWLKTTSEFIVLRNGDAIVGSLAIGTKTGKYPSCQLPGAPAPPVLLPLDDDGVTGDEHVLALCNGAYSKVLLSAYPFRQPNPCPPPPIGGDAGYAGGAGGAPSVGADGSVAPACKVSMAKLDIVQPDSPSLPPNPAQAVELLVSGSFTAGVTRISDCGASSLGPYDPDAQDGTCGLAAGYYDEIAIGSLVVPASGRLVVGNRPEADLVWTSALGQTASVLHPGPALIAVRAAAGEVLAAVAYPSAAQPEIWPTCPAVPLAEPIPADENGSGPPDRNQVLVRCETGEWALVDESAVSWHAAQNCRLAPPNVSGAAGSDGGSGSDGSGGMPASVGFDDGGVGASSAIEPAPASSSGGCTFRAPRAVSPAGLALGALLLALAPRTRRAISAAKGARRAR